MRFLLVGDIHAVPEELDDCAQLKKLVEFASFAEQVDVVVLLGDGYHTHNVIRAEVMAFYRAWFKEWKTKTTTKIISLVGNHDYAGEGHPVHAMQIHEDQIKVVDQPQQLGGILFLPYYSDHDKFVADVHAHPTARTLVCHQTFKGSRYENGLEALDGIDLARLPKRTIISGHIHTPQSFDDVTYIGAPRWRSLSDANVERAIWVYDFDAQGNVTQKFPFDTGEYCRKIRYVLITPDDPFDGEMDPKHDWRVDIRGDALFVAVQKKLWSKPGVRVRTFLTDRAVRVRESEGIGTAFKKYLKDYTPKHGTPIEVLEQMARERLSL
jgi:DNA repair exonuclease SbcCD nuclease subunit